MKEVLKSFTHKSLSEACCDMLDSLLVSYSNAVTRQSLSFCSLYRNTLSEALSKVVDKVEALYYIGNIDEETLSGSGEAKSIEAVESATSEGKYESMMVFAVDIRKGNTLARSECATLTRGFNRIAAAQPVILFVREGNKLTLSTCERMEYSQEWRRGVGEKLGKVSMLKGIDCRNPHRGHIDILKSLGDKRYPSFDELYKHWIDVFSAQPLTKGFYRDLFEWYQWAVDPETKVSFPGDVSTQDDDRENIDTRVIRLITRLMFVWFIKQKGLVPDRIFNVKDLCSILKDFDPQSTTDTNYYQAILQNLFFGTLNRAIIEDGERREFAKAAKSDVKNLYRYEELFSISEDKVIELFSTVPFLNCGLFECQDKSKTLDGVEKRFYNDGFSRNEQRWKDGTYKYRATVPNVLFFHPEKGIITIFNRYVFTIEENTPQDVQVALDPELLGKVFENLLGAYNPETKETARNQSGSFYTPREIVQYMVNESLVAHLKRTVDENLEDKFRQLLDFSTQEVELTDEQKHQIVHALFTCKILDPACGSGAFPMGMLQQMVHVLRQVDPDNNQWREVLLDMASEDSRRAFGIADEEERNKKLDEIRNTFNNALNSPDYARKLYIIESCIYGVDIQPIAMLITRLRFFITLICEQNEIMRDKPEENFGIKTLPNLESKFVAANSLISADIHKYNNDWTQDAELSIMKDELMAIRRRHFYTRKRSEKIRLLKADEKKREQIHEYINKLVGEPNEKRIAELKNTIKEKEAELLKYQGERWVEEHVQTDLFSPPKTVRYDANKRFRDNINCTIANCHTDIEREKQKSIPSGFEAAVLQVTDWNPYDQNTVSPFLDIDWMFGVRDGFDIVIGNPPYRQIKWYSTIEKIAFRNANFSTYDNKSDIYCLFYEKGVNLLKRNAILTFITSNKWLYANYGALTRQWLLYNSNPSYIIDLGPNVFDKVSVDTNILIANKSEYVSTKYGLLKDNLNVLDFLECHLDANSIWNIENARFQSLKYKVDLIKSRLTDFGVELNYGILTGANTAFIINKQKSEELIIKDNKNANLIKPIYRGKDIERYSAIFRDVYLLCFHNGIRAKGISPVKIQDYPTLKDYFDSFGKEFWNRGEQGDTVYNLRNCAYLDKYKYPKILYADIVQDEGRFYLDEEGYYTNDTAFMISGGTHLHFLLGILNSTAFTFFYKNFYCGSKLGKKGLRYKRDFLLKVPIPMPSNNQEEVIKDYVRIIQKKKKNNAQSDTSVEERKIDNIVFDLYGLTEEERNEIIKES